MPLARHGRLVSDQGERNPNPYRIAVLMVIDRQRQALEQLNQALSVYHCLA
jgi:hypothetical protein